MTYEAINKIIVLVVHETSVACTTALPDELRECARVRRGGPPKCQGQLLGLIAKRRVHHRVADFAVFPTVIASFVMVVAIANSQFLEDAFEFLTVWITSAHSHICGLVEALRDILRVVI